MSKTRIIVDEKDNKKLVTNLYLQTNPPLENVQRIKLLFHDIHFLLHTWVLDVNIDAYLLFLKDNIIFDTNRPFLRLDIFIDDITKTNIAQYIKNITVDHHIECTLENFIECESNTSSASVVTIKIFNTKISKSFEYLVNKCYEAHFQIYNCPHLKFIRPDDVEANHKVSYYGKFENLVTHNIESFYKKNNTIFEKGILNINFGKTVGHLYINEPINVDNCMFYQNLTSLDVHLIHNLDILLSNNPNIHTLRLRDDHYHINFLIVNTQLKHLYLNNPYDYDIIKILCNNTHLESFKSDSYRIHNPIIKTTIHDKDFIKNNFRLIEIGSYNFGVVGIEKLILSKCKKVNISINITYNEILNLITKYPDNLYLANILSNNKTYLSSVVLNYVNRILTKNQTLEFILDGNTNFYDRYTWV